MTSVLPLSLPASQRYCDLQLTPQESLPSAHSREQQIAIEMARSTGATAMLYTLAELAFQVYMLAEVSRHAVALSAGRWDSTGDGDTVAS